MFCTESCEHCANATSSQQRKLQQHQQQQRQQEQQQSQHFATQHPCCNMCYGPMSAAELWLQGCDSEPMRMGMCFVTEGPEGLSIDCNVPIPNSFHLDEYKTQMLSLFASPGNNSDVAPNDCTPCCLQQPQVESAVPAPTATRASAENVSSNEGLPKTGKQSKFERSRKRTQPQQQSSSSECAFYPTSYAPPTDMCLQMNASPSMIAVPDTQLLAYLSGLIAPMQQVAATTTASAYQNLQMAPSCCLVEVRSLMPPQQQQQYQQQPIFAAGSQPLLHIELPCRLTGFRSSQPHPEQSQPPVALQLLSLPGAISLPAIPQPTPSLLSSPTILIPKPPMPVSTASSSSSSDLPYTMPAAVPKMPNVVNPKATPHINVEKQYCCAPRNPYSMGNINGNGIRHINGHRNANLNGNCCLAQGWRCPCCPHCCCHPSQHLSVDQQQRL